MATHSSTLVWKIPWTEVPGRLQSMGSPRVRHNWMTSLSLFTFTHWRRKWQPTPVLLPGESQGRCSLKGSRLWGCTDWSDLAAAAAASSTHYIFVGKGINSFGLHNRINKLKKKVNYVPVGKDGCMFAIPLLSPFLGSWLDCILPNGSHYRVWLINYGGNDCIYFQIWFLKRSSVTFFHCLSTGCKESRGELGSEGMVETLEPWVLQSRASCHLSWIIVSVINCNCLILLRLLIIVFFVVVQSLSRIWLFATPGTAAHQLSLSFAIS